MSIPPNPGSDPSASGRDFSEDCSEHAHTAENTESHENVAHDDGCDAHPEHTEILELTDVMRSPLASQAQTHKASQGIWQSRRVRAIAACVALALPIIVGAFAAPALHVSPQSVSGEQTSESTQSSDSGASSDLVAARRALGEASTQADLLHSGVVELHDGATTLADGTQQLSDGVTQAKDGAAQLSDGMVQLQAGVGQAGEGATQIADGVDTAVTAITGVEALRQEILSFIDKAQAELKDLPDARAQDMYKQLTDVRAQVQAAEIDATQADQLNQLRSGARELANQLTQPGQALHDGVYTLTEGAQSLSSGMQQLSDGAASAASGSKDLADGAARVETMADQNTQKVSAGVTAVNTAAGIGADAESSASANDAAASSSTGGTSVLAPMSAFLIATLVALGSAFAWISSEHSESRRGRWISGVAGIALAVVMGALLVGFTAVGLSIARLSAMVGILVLTALTSAVCTHVVRTVLGMWWARGVLFVGVVVQIAVVGMAWRGASLEGASTVWSWISGLMPLHYSTAALSTLSSGAGSGNVALWLSVAVLGVLTLAAVGVSTIRSRRGALEGA